MKQISDFFSKIKTKLLASRFLKDSIVEVVKKNTGISLNPKNLNFSHGTVFIKTSPIKKTEIFIKKGVILSELESVCGKGKVTDLR